MSHAGWAPLMVFGLLMLAGLNIPISEDAMIFISALIARERPDLLWQLFFAVYAGAYLSDVLCYALGRRYGLRVWDIPWFNRMVPRGTVHKVGQFYDRYGVLVLIVGRFIPFGVRNALFLTAGIGKMNWTRFIVADLIAATISCVCFFWLYYTFGAAVVSIVREGNQVLFGVALAVAIGFVIRHWRAAKRRQAALVEAENSEAPGSDSSVG
ncbi:MAG: hypothetical protein RJA70_638 [Pseudomonadota bacterium]